MTWEQDLSENIEEKARAYWQIPEDRIKEAERVFTNFKALIFAHHLNMPTDQYLDALAGVRRAVELVMLYERLEQSGGNISQ